MTFGAGVSERSGRSLLAGWTVVSRLAVRRERLPVVLWVMATVGAVLSSVSAIASLYPDAASRQQLAATIQANPAFLALNGPLTTTSVGAVVAWRIGVYGSLAVAYLSAATVVRRTRAEEEAGRAQLLASGVVGRVTLLAAALSVAWISAVAIGVLCTLGCIADGLPAGGSLALGAALTGPGLVFAALAAVAVQVFGSARGALSATGLALGCSYGLRAVADSWPSAHWLSVVSPFGWSQRLSPYGETRWWLVGLFGVSSAVLTVVAIRLQVGRDIGLGLFPARLGPPGSVRLRSGVTLAARLHRAALAGWLAGLAVFRALTGSLAATSGGLLGNARIEKLVQQVGGAGRPADELFAVMAAIAGALAAAYAVAATLRLHSEEAGGRAELALSTGLSRTRMLAGHLLFSLGGAAALLVVAGLAAGVVYGVASGDVARGVGIGLSAMAVQIPAVLVVGGLTAALVGWLPRQAIAAWMLLAAFFLLGQLGRTLGLPQVLMDVSPFTHVPPLPAGAVTVTPLVVLTLLAVVAAGAGLLGFSRRDVG